MLKRVAKVFVKDDSDKILLIRRSKTAPRRPLEWDLPGGFVEHAEDPKISAQRELFEETGLRIEDPSLAFTDTRVLDDDTVVWFYFITSVNSDSLKLSYEHDKSIWISKEDFFKYVSYDKQLDAFKAIKKLL